MLFRPTSRVDLLRRIASQKIVTEHEIGLRAPFGVSYMPLLRLMADIGLFGNNALAVIIL